MLREINVITGEETQIEFEDIQSFSSDLLKQYRDQVWSNAVITLDNGAELTTDEITQQRIARAFTLCTNVNDDNFTIRWKCNNGHYVFSTSDFQEAILKGSQPMQKAFLAEAHVLDGSYETWSAAKEAFDTFMEG